MPTTVPTYAEFVAQYPEFATLQQAVVESRLSLSSRILSKRAWGDFFSDAIGLDTAHNLAIQAAAGATPTGGFQGAVGPVSSVSAAGISTSFNTPSVDVANKSDSWYMKTSYGQQFLLLRDQVIPMGVMSV
jgi:hypothetical protein